MRLEPARAVVPCAARGRRARTSLPSGSSALASPPPGGLPGRLALGCPRSLRPGPTILQSRLPELGRGSPALSAGKCRERLGPLARGSAHSRGWKNWGRCRGKPAGAPGAWRPPALFQTASRCPPPPRPALNTQRAPSLTWEVASCSLSLQSRGWSLAGVVLLNLSSYFHFYLNAITS